uniref:ATP synthase complex subunit 8 n=1 Tax=Hexanematichthys sagor TaxID=591287 RepID=C7SRA9_9TELE|nr:ATP synthase subunit 8 [Hexanematichthys sagor]
MPQLNPTPWLTIFMSSWLIFLTVVPLKILSHTFTNNSTTLTTKNLKSTWNWPWH